MLCLTRNLKPLRHPKVLFWFTSLIASRIDDSFSPDPALHDFSFFKCSSKMIKDGMIIVREFQSEVGDLFVFD